MDIVTWNVNSLKARHDYAALFLDAHAPDVVCLQELKLEDAHVPRELFTSRGYTLETHGQKQYNGVAIASRLPMEAVTRGFDGEEGESRLIAARIDGVDVVNLYCPQGQSEDSPKFAYKKRFYEALLAWLPEHVDLGGQAIVTGDLNIAPTADDIYDPEKFANVPSFHPDEHALWARLEALGLVDVVKPHIEPHTYSFWDYRGAAFRFGKGMRIDHFMATEAVAARVAGAEVIRDFRKKKQKLTASDHAPVRLVLK